MGLKLLDVLEIYHRAGFIHNDLSLDKVVFGQNQVMPMLKDVDETENVFENKTLHIVDF